MHRYIESYHKHAPAAREAFRIFQGYCGRPIPRVPGMDTVIRLAWRLEHGHSPAEAAAREYLYRWNLAIKPPDQINLNRGAWSSEAAGGGMLASAASIFGAPHAIGM